MSDLAAFLRARMTEDEGAARGLLHATRVIGGEPDFYGQGGPAASAFWQHFTARRMLLDVAAKWAIVAEYESVRKLKELTGGKIDGYRDWILRQIASAYADHPDYQQEWKL